jgi:hypothetical protein
MSGNWAIQKTKQVYLLVVSKHTSFCLSAEELTGRPYAVERTVGLNYCINGPMVVVNYRNMKLFLNNGRCVQTDSKQCFSNTTQTQHIVLHSISHSAFNVLNILTGIRYIKER